MQRGCAFCAEKDPNPPPVNPFEDYMRRVNERTARNIRPQDIEE